jgi:tripartite-type tricarboxylate transporter receptor subunit TctC
MESKMSNKLISILLTAICMTTSAYGQTTYPNKPITVIVSVAVATGGDVAIRMVAQKMSENMGVTIAIENLPGAGGILGGERVAKAPPDGYIIGGFTDAAVTTSPLLYPNLPYDPFISFVPVGLLAHITMVMITSPTLQVKTVKELIALSHAQGSPLSYASGGSGSPMHLSMEIFKATTQTNILHIPYRSAMSGVTDVMGGRVSVMIMSLAPTLELIHAKKVNALGVTSSTRSSLLPDLPTVAESGLPGFAFSAWVGLVAPKNTPQHIISKLNSEMVKAMNDPVIKQRLISLGFDPVGSSPEQLATQMRTGYNKNAKIIKSAGITAD